MYFDSGGVTSSEVGITNFTKLISSTIVSWLAVKCQNKTQDQYWLSRIYKVGSGSNPVVSKVEGTNDFIWN